MIFGGFWHLGDLGFRVQLSPKVGISKLQEKADRENFPKSLQKTFRWYFNPDFPEKFRSPW